MSLLHDGCFKQFLANFVCKHGKKCIYGTKIYGNEGGTWLEKCPDCGYENPEGTNFCEECGHGIPSIGKPHPFLYSGSSGMVTTSTFSTVVDSLPTPNEYIIRSELEEKVTSNAIGILLSLGYICKVSEDKYGLTEKGVKAYFENKAFRLEVDKVKKILKSKYGLE